MRTIKYRAWLEMKKRMFSWEELINLEIHQFSEYPISLAHLGQEPFIWLQFTGLLDKNGKEIWEGDIIEMDDREYGEGRPKNLRVVDFEDGSFTTNTWSKSDIQEWCEVIGNIYSNPELLNKN